MSGATVDVSSELDISVDETSPAVGVTVGVFAFESPVVDVAESPVFGAVVGSETDVCGDEITPMSGAAVEEVEEEISVDEMALASGAIDVDSEAKLFIDDTSPESGASVDKLGSDVCIVEVSPVFCSSFALPVILSSVFASGV